MSNSLQIKLLDNTERKKLELRCQVALCSIVTYFTESPANVTNLAQEQVQGTEDLSSSASAPQFISNQASNASLPA